MSYRIGMDTLNLVPTPRLAHTEYCSNAALHRHVEATTGKRFNDAWQLDFIWTTNDGPVAWHQRGRTTDMGHAEFLEGGVDLRQPKPSPFTDPEQVLAFDAVEEYGLPDLDELVDFYEGWHRRTQADHPEQVVPGGYYKTIVSGAIEAFGWEMLLTAAADEAAFEKVLDSFFRLTLHHAKAWAKTSIPMYLNHDDMVWTAGPFMSPAFYRRVIFPRYAEIWATVKRAGKRVLFCSDGDFSMFLEDLAAAGADGFIFEPVMDLDTVIDRFGQSHVIVGSKVDCRTMTFGSPTDIHAEIDATLARALDCPGFMFAVGNHIPSNVPVPNCVAYMDHLAARWHRRQPSPTG